MDGELFYTALLYLLLLAFKLVMSLETQKNSSAMFVFGDSLVDAGNNNYLNCYTKANFEPYGIDMPNREPTGRYSNGLAMGEEPVLPYLDARATGSNLVRGINFASAGVGILPDSGSFFNQRLLISLQLECFQKVCNRLAKSLGTEAADSLVSKALVFVAVGANDYINNYLLPYSKRFKDYSLPAYQNLLISTLREHIKALYTTGARKIAVSNIGPIGCTPAQLALHSRNGSCMNQWNRIALSYNLALKLMLRELNKELPGALLVYVNSFNVIMSYIKNPASGGFKYGSMACCGNGPYHGLIICNPFSSLCPNRSEYIFWDSYHPTEALNRLFARRILYGSLQDVSPINIRQLLGT